MSLKQYFVVMRDGEWKINFEDQFVGAFPDQASATRAAIDAAHLEGSRGSDTQVLVQAENNMIRTVWTFGQDPYPPDRKGIAP